MVVPLAFGWRDLLFANWRVDADAVDERLPDALPVQTYDGSAWLTVVPFVNVDLRPRGLPPELGYSVPELNLRTYVTHEGEPGVYFFSLDARSVLATIGARFTHRLPYYYARIEYERTPDGVRFGSRRLHPGSRPVRYEATYRLTGEPFEAEPGSLAEFLTERRRLYTQGQDGRVRYTDVAHDRWTLYEAEQSVAENTLFEANGFEVPTGDPVLYYSPGVDVVTSRSRRR